MINFTVGPVQAGPEVLELGSRQVPYFRTPEFSRVMLENERRILKFAQAPQGARAVFLTGSGTAAMEAAVAQHNYENEAARSLVTESGKNRRAEAELALEAGDLTALEDMGFDTDYLEWIQALTLAAEAK